MATYFYGSKVSSVWRAYGCYTTSSANTSYTVSLDGGFQSIDWSFSIHNVSCEMYIGSTSTSDDGLAVEIDDVSTTRVELLSLSKTITRTTSDQTVTLKVKVTNSSSYKDGTSTASTVITVPARTSYTISYDANGGSGAPSSQTKYYGYSLTLSTTEPTRSGYTFLGWSTDSDATTADYEAGDSYTDNASATLYAVWSIDYLSPIIYRTGSWATRASSSTAPTSSSSKDDYYDEDGTRAAMFAKIGTDDSADSSRPTVRYYFLDSKDKNSYSEDGTPPTSYYYSGSTSSSSYVKSSGDSSDDGYLLWYFGRSFYNSTYPFNTDETYYVYIRITDCNDYTSDVMYIGYLDNTDTFIMDFSPTDSIGIGITAGDEGGGLYIDKNTYLYDSLYAEGSNYLNATATYYDGDMPELSSSDITSSGFDTFMIDDGPEYGITIPAIVREGISYEYSLLADGIVIKRGFEYASVTASGTVTSHTVTFNDAFPNACLDIFCRLQTTAPQSNFCSVSAKSTTSFTYYVYRESSSSSIYFYWVAIGY